MLQQEGIMTVRGRNKMVLDIFAELFEGLDHLFGVVRRVEPVRREGKELYGRLYQLKCFLKGLIPEGDIVKIECFCQIEEGVGIETVDKVVAVVVQIALDLEFTEKIEEAVFCRVAPAELGLHRLV